MYMEDGKLMVPDNVVIPFIEGDGVGAEITPVCQKIVNAAVELAYVGKRSIEWKEVLAGGKAFEKTGEWLPQATLDAFKEYLVGIDLYVCLRPVRWFKGVVSPVKEPHKVNMYIFRENTEDIYAGIEWEQGTPEAQKFYKFLHDEMGVTKVRFPETSSFGVKPVSKEGTQRLVRAAIQFALGCLQ